MAAEPGDLALRYVFSKAFLVELQRGNLEQATLFARAFLARPAPRILTAALVL